MSHPEEKTYFVRLTRYDLENNPVGGTDFYASQIKDIHQRIIEHEKQGYRSAEEMESRPI